MIEITDSAANAIRTAMGGSTGDVQGLRVMVESGGCAGFKYMMGLVAEASPGDFVGSISPNSQSATAGTDAVYGATISQLSGFTGNVTLSVSGLPPGASASFSPSNVISGGSGTANLTIGTTGVVPGTYTLLVTGTSGGLSHSGSVTLTIN